MGIDPTPPTFLMSQPVTVLRLEARNSTPAPGMPVIRQLRTVLLSAVAPASLPSNTIPRARDPVILTFSTSELLPRSKSSASLLLRAVPRPTPSYSES